MKTYVILLVTVFSLFACHKENGQKEIQQDCYTPPTLEIYINKDNISIGFYLLVTQKDY